jgi:predicted ATP-dependent endonuclease of OLD family
MPYIKEFTIHGLCGRKLPIHYKFNRYLNIFFGLNGSGKTSLLKILHSAMKHQLISQREAFFEKAEVIICSEKDHRDFIKKIDLTETSNQTIKQRRVIRSKGKEKVLIEESIGEQAQWYCNEGIEVFRHSYLPTTRLFMDIERFNLPYFFEHRFDDRGEAEDIFNKIFEKGLMESWGTYYSIISKKIREAQQEGLTNVFSEVFKEKRESSETLQKYDSNIAFEKVHNFLKRQNPKLMIGNIESFSKRLQNDELLERVVIQIEEVENKIENYSAPINQLQNVVKNLFSGNKKVVFEDDGIKVTTDEEKLINLSQLSSGEKNLLKMLIELFLVEDSALLIDEPELSLHIDWQRELVRTMRTLNPDAQIILATHSPDIVGSADESETFYLG